MVPTHILHHNRRVIGDWLMRMRTEKGYNQQEFADLTGLNRPTISKIERGKWGIGVDYISVYAHYLKFDLEEFFN
jgi:transcriptional regulator with XRE-family HTH domain